MVTPRLSQRVLQSVPVPFTAHQTAPTQPQCPDTPTAPARPPGPSPAAALWGSRGWHSSAGLAQLSGHSRQCPARTEHPAPQGRTDGRNSPTPGMDRWTEIPQPRARAEPRLSQPPPGPSPAALLCSHTGHSSPQREPINPQRGVDKPKSCTPAP